MISDAGTSSVSPLLAVAPIGGLTNRMRVVSSFAVLADLTGRQFRLCWAPSDGFSDEDLDELFQNEFPALDAAAFESFCHTAFCLHEAVTITGVAGIDRRWRWTEGSSVADLLDASVRPEVAYRGLFRVDQFIGPEAASRLPTEWKDLFVRHLRAWRPVDSIQRTVDALTASFATASVVGVHVRRGDAIGDRRIGDQFRRSTDAAFFARMDDLLTEDPAMTFWLATDDPRTEAGFRARYDTAIRTNEDKRFVSSIPGEPKENQRDAIVDLFVLARTRAILGTVYSSYSQTAATIGDIPLELAVDRRPLARAGRKLASLRRRLSP